MAWIMNEYSKYEGFHPACVTGKPVEFHGSAGREAATGFGVAIVTREILARLKQTISGTTFAIQGYGNVGSHTARCLAQMGGKIIAVSDAYGAVVNQEGLDIAELDKHVGALAQDRRLQGRRCDDQRAAPDDAGRRADSGRPGGGIDRELAKAVAAKMVVEAANSPTWPEADEVFNARGIPVVPDVLANAGGVIVSYFEWVQNLQHFRWPLGPDPARGRTQACRGLSRSLRPLPAQGRNAANRRLHEGNLTGRPGANPGRDVRRDAEPP